MRTLLYLLIGVIYIILIVVGLGMVYTVGEPVPAKAGAIMEPDNRISIAHTEIFGKLERPQVIFYHKKHEEALKAEGCAECHPVDENKKLLFDFPKQVRGKGEKAVMKAYHDECIECHKQKSREKIKSGPVVCADCHKDELKSTVVKYPVAEFDFAFHDKHVTKLKEKIGKDDCGQCHHIYSFEEKKLIYKEKTEESCYYCHELEKKRGPELAKITKVSSEKGLSVRRASHQQCLNCHLKYKEEYLKKGDKEAVPTECIKCHTGKYKTIAELEKIPRPDRDQKDTPFINIENSRMKGVTVDHKSHEKYARNCRSCHHETLKACKECHNLTGKPEGNNVNVANAYHNMFSEHSCAGCHNEKKKQKECAGCHNYIAPMDLETLSPKKETCASCHAGKKERISLPPMLSTAGLNKEKVKKDVEIKVIEKEYEPAKFPHLDVIDKLVKISNDSNLARYFHKDMETLCAGCHHRSTEAAEAQKDTPPYCRNCHMVAYDRKNTKAIRLLTAYHNQCMGCHDAMKIEKGSSVQFGEGDRCADCHKKKAEAPAEITKMKNQNVYNQNKKLILQNWTPE